MNRAQRRQAARDHLPVRGHGVIGRPDMVIEAGSPGTDAMEKAAALDRAWFQAYPGISEYLRPAIPNEFQPIESDEAVWGRVPPPDVPEGYVLLRVIRVAQLEPGARTRIPLFCACPAGEAGGANGGMGRAVN
jgi:hypothetical protein